MAQEIWEALFRAFVGFFQRRREANYNVFVCLVDYQKAFDCVKHGIMIRILKEITDEKDLKICDYIYWRQIVVLKNNDKTTDSIEILSGVMIMPMTP